MRSISLLIPFTLATALIAQQPMTSEQVAQIRSVVDLAVSPDGRQVAYTLNVQRTPFADDDGPARRHLYVWDETLGSRPYVVGDFRVWGLDWTPDGSRISYLAKREGDDAASLYTISVNGGESKRVLSHATAIKAYSWRPDGASVAFIAAEEKGDKDLEEQGFNQQVYEESIPSVGLWLADLSGEQPDREELTLDGSLKSVSWSPDGTKMAVVIAPTPLVDDDLMGRRVWVLKADGQVVTKFKNPGKLGSVVWSPDSGSVAMISGVAIHDPRAGTVTVGTVSDGELRMLLSGFGGHADALDWSDPSRILALYSVGVQSRLIAIDPVSGKDSTLIAGAGPVFGRFDQAGKTMALIANAPSHPNELFVWTPGKRKQPAKVTNHNPFLADLALGVQEVVNYKARDGVELQGILIRPLNQQADRRYPLIVCVHGGPESHIDNGWLTRYSYPGQVAAGQGFASFYPNYRGSTGRGVAFSKLSQGDPAGAEFDDIVDGVDWLIEMGLVDASRVGVTGGSYGGYATAWMSTYYSDRFAAGVMFVGISDKLSKVGTTDIPDEEMLVHAMKRPWETEASWNFFLQRSPIYHADKSRTPLLILHGKEDPRVHPSQSMEMYRHLKIRGQAPVRLVFYPGEGHGNRRAASRYDFSLRQMRWLTQYLQGSGGDPPEYPISYPLEKKAKAPEPAAEAGF